MHGSGTCEGTMITKNGSRYNIRETERKKERKPEKNVTDIIVI